MHVGGAATEKTGEMSKNGSVIGFKLDFFDKVGERRPLDKLLSILDNPEHPSPPHPGQTAAPLS